MAGVEVAAEQRQELASFVRDEFTENIHDVQRRVNMLPGSLVSVFHWYFNSLAQHPEQIDEGTQDITKINSQLLEYQRSGISQSFEIMASDPNIATAVTAFLSLLDDINYPDLSERLREIQMGFVGLILLIYSDPNNLNEYSPVAVDEYSSQNRILELVRSRSYNEKDNFIASLENAYPVGARIVNSLSEAILDDAKALSTMIKNSGDYRELRLDAEETVSIIARYVNNLYNWYSAITGIPIEGEFDYSVDTYDYQPGFPADGRTGALVEAVFGRYSTKGEHQVIIDGILDRLTYLKISREDIKSMTVEELSNLLNNRELKPEDISSAKQYIENSKPKVA